MYQATKGSLKLSWRGPLGINLTRTRGHAATRSPKHPDIHIQLQIELALSGCIILVNYFGALCRGLRYLQRDLQYLALPNFF